MTTGGVFEKQVLHASGSSRLQSAARFLWRNPVMVKEVRTRMRGRRAFTIVSIHLIVLSAILALAYIIFSSSLTTVSNLEQRRIFGKVIFGLLVWLELVTICFTAPALTSGAISSERERQTFDLLKVTLLSPGRLVFGKYLSALVFIFLLLFSALPLQSLAFIIGGVLTQEILIAILILAVTAIAFCAVGMYFSSLFSRVLTSTVLSYAFAIFLVFGIPMLLLFLLYLFSAAAGSSLTNLSIRSQVLLIFIGWLVVSITPAGTIIATEAALLDQQGIILAHIDIANGVQVFMPSPWVAYVITYLSISLVLLWFSVQRVRRPEN